LLRDLSLGGCKLKVAAHLAASSSEPAICSLSFEMILARSISVKNVVLMCFLINNEVPVFSLTKDDSNSVKTIKLYDFGLAMNY
jgi:hypothetical protein